MTGTVVWLTGLPSSGKSTLAERVRIQLDAKGLTAVLLDGDELRPILHADGYTDSQRDDFYHRLAALAAMLARQGLVVLVPATAPRRSHRDAARALAPRLVEVWVETPLAECEARDPKGLYARARREATTLPGVGAPYEAPSDADVVASGGRDDVAITKIVDAVLDRG